MRSFIHALKRRPVLYWIMIFVLAFSIKFGGIIFLTDEPEATDPVPVVELVMRPDTAISVVSRAGQLKLTALSKFERRYEWNGCKTKVALRPRSERWFGNLGAYDPGFSWGFFTRSCNGVSRAVVEEGQIHFDDKSFAEEWVSRKPRGFDTVWSSDGVLVTWGISPQRSQLNVDVWLMCFDGKPYAPIKDAKHKLVISGNGDGAPIFNCADVTKSAIDDTRKQIEGFWAENDKNRSGGSK